MNSLIPHGSGRTARKSWFAATVLAGMLSLGVAVFAQDAPPPPRQRIRQDNLRKAWDGTWAVAECRALTIRLSI